MTIYYLGHSSFAIDLPDKLLVFDYINGWGTGGLDKGFVNPADFKEKNILFMATHEHSDHYDASFHKETAVLDNVYWVLGDINTLAPHTTCLKPREAYNQLGSELALRIDSCASTDLGCAFLVQTEHICIYHGGDNCDWGDGPENARFYEEMDYLAGCTKYTDVAMIPVCTSSGQRPAEMTQSARYAMDRLKPGIVLPMHANGLETLYDAFAADIGQSPHMIHCMHRTGEGYDYKRSNND